MSFYATLSGKIKFKDPAVFERIVQMLKDQEYISENERFLNEDDEEFNEASTHIFRSSLTIVIPWGLYRNFSSILDKIFNKEDVEGKIVGTSTDGCFLGWVTTKKAGVLENKEYDLEKWAKEDDNGEEIPDSESDDYVDLMADLENDFHATFGD